MTTVQELQSRNQESPAPVPAQGPIPTGYFIVGAMLAFFAIAFGSLLVWALVVQKPEHLKKKGASKLKIIGEVPDFKLIDQNGSPVDRAALGGKLWVADFIFTRCAGPCRIMSMNMRQLQDQLLKAGSLGDRIRFVSISVDPEFDTQQILADYASGYGAAPGRWHFLRGDYEAIQTLAREGFKLGLSKADPENKEPIIHSQSFVLIDGKGRIRGYYDGVNASEVEKLYADALRLATELEG